VVAEEVAVLPGIGPPDLGEGLVRNERGVAAVLVPVVEEDDLPSGRDQRRRGVHAPGARADDEDVGHARERTAAAYTTAPSAARATATVSFATRERSRRRGRASRGRNSSANAGEVSRMAAMSRIFMRSRLPGRSRPEAASSSDTLHGWRRAKATSAASSRATGSVKIAAFAAR